jgi:alpha-glucosidase
MCYTFDLLGPDFTPSHIRHCVESFQKQVKDGWVCWAFSNHDVTRHVSRFLQQSEERVAVAKISISVLATLRGSICLYQGEELGLPEAELSFEDLRDPYGIRFWPAFKGRDGCRTPMVWEKERPHAGFSSAKPWLPVPAEHQALAVNAQDKHEESVLAHYRAVLAFRKQHPALIDGDMHFLATNEDVLAFTRKKDDEQMLFVFNLRRGPQEIALPHGMTIREAVAMPGLSGEVVDGDIRLGPLDGFCARLT